MEPPLHPSTVLADLKAGEVGMNNIRPAGAKRFHLPGTKFVEIGNTAMSYRPASGSQTIVDIAPWH